MITKNNDREKTYKTIPDIKKIHCALFLCYLITHSNDNNNTNDINNNENANNDKYNSSSCECNKVVTDILAKLSFSVVMKNRSKASS